AEQAAIGTVRYGQVDVLDGMGVAELLRQVDQPDLSGRLRLRLCFAWRGGSGSMIHLAGPPALDDDDGAESDGDDQKGNQRRRRTERIERGRRDVGGHRPYLERQGVLRTHGQI